MNVTDLMLDYIIKKSNSDIGDEVYLKAKQCLIDYIGVTYGGAWENVNIIKEVCGSEETSGNVKICGTEISTDMLKTVFFNGFNAHTMELDDGSRFGMIHLGAAVISPLVAMVQKESIDYNNFLKAIIMGYEMAVRCSVAMQPEHKKRGFHTSGTCGTLGAAVAVAVARGYNREQLKSTISAAATSAAGVLEIQENSSQLKPYNLAHGAMSGFMAAEMGKTAILGPDDILGGKRGVFRLLGNDINLDCVKETDYFEIERIYVKPYGACRHCHTAIEATLELRNKVKNTKDIKEINVYTYKLAILGHNHKKIQGKSSAKLSIPYSVASAMILGKSDIAAFEEKNINNSDILQLTGKVNVFEDEEYTKEASNKRISKVEVIMENGEKLCKEVQYAKGDQENPMSHREIIDKFNYMMKWCGKEDKGNFILNKLER